MGIESAMTMNRHRKFRDATAAIVFLAAFVGLPAFALWAFPLMTGLLSHPL